MIDTALKTRFRATCSRLLLNRFVTRTVDWLRPATSLGDRGERYAERFLKRLGCVIVDRNYRNLIGEIDLIAVDQRTIVFVEVKTRASDYAGMPAEAVDDSKQNKIAKAATVYLKQQGLLECRVRFDVISVICGLSKGQADCDHQIEHIRDAFNAPVHTW